MSINHWLQTKKQPIGAVAIPLSRGELTACTKHFLHALYPRKQMIKPSLRTLNWVGVVYWKGCGSPFLKEGLNHKLKLEQLLFPS